MKMDDNSFRDSFQQFVNLDCWLQVSKGLRQFKVWLPDARCESTSVLNNFIVTVFNYAGWSSNILSDKLLVPRWM